MNSQQQGKIEGKEAGRKVGSTEAEGPRDKTTKFLREKKVNQEKLGSSLRDDMPGVGDSMK